MSDTIMIHILRNYAPSSLNRGEDGSPKSAMFGGEWRGRISSQSLKRAIRRSPQFEQFSEEGLTAVRTRQLPIMIGGALARRGWKTDDVEAVVKRLSEVGKTSEKAEKTAGLTNQMILIPASAVEALADQIAKVWATPAWGQELEKVIQPVDMLGVDTALFGAMTTSAIFPDVRAACQVSHALSVNVSRRMVDFFTAVDDLSGDSSMIGESFFNSNCYYWTIAVNIQMLIANLKGDARLAKSVIAQLIEAASVAHPSGKQNTFASHPPSDLVLLEWRKGPIFDYANAFVKPVEPGDGLSLTEAAVVALAQYIERVDKMYPRPARAAYASLLDHEMRGERFDNLAGLIEDTTRHVS